MNFLARLFRPPNATHSPSSRAPRIALFGDSHTAAIQAAKDYPDRRHVYEHVRIHRLRKIKNGKDVGDTDLTEFCEIIRNFAEDDFVFSAVGGNQYAVVSTVQSPIDYDVLTSPDDGELSSPDLTLVPFRALVGHIERGIRGSLGPVLREIRNSTRAQVIHLAPPPPKKSNDFIARHFESRFAKQGLGDLGPTRPELRLKCWRLQNDALSALCAEIGVVLVEPPWRTVTPEGYLSERCYAKDVTHGNRRYGEYVLKDILMMTDTSYAPETTQA